MALAPFREVNRRLAPRSLRVLISPAPSTFAERRSILQVLQQYGTIDVFKREDQRADRYISLARSDETAKTLVDTSPIACRVSLPRISHDKRARQLERLAEPTLPKIDIQTKTEGGATSWDTTATATTTTTGSLPGQDEQYKAQDAAAAAAALSAEDTFETREFELTIVPVRDYDHGVAATKAIEYSRWPAGFEADRSFAAAVLQETLPSTLAGKGLSRWHVNPALGTPRDSMSQRLERKQQVPGQMAAEAARTSRGSD